MHTHFMSTCQMIRPHAIIHHTKLDTSIKKDKLQA